MIDRFDLTVGDIVLIHQFIMQEGGDSPALLLATDGLASALQRPAHARFYEDADLATQAARLIDGIATAHAFLDGNKRTATAAGETFLRFRNHQIASPSSDDTTLGRQVEMLVASQDGDALARFVAWLRDNLRGFDWVYDDWEDDADWQGLATDDGVGTIQDVDEDYRAFQLAEAHADVRNRAAALRAADEYAAKLAAEMFPKPTDEG